MELGVLKVIYITICMSTKPRNTTFESIYKTIFRMMSTFISKIQRNFTEF